MTIKGIAVRSTIEIAKEFSIAYAYRPADPWMFVEKSSRDKPHKDRVCNYFFIIYLWCMSQLKFTDTNLQYSTVLSKMYTLLLVYIFAGTNNNNNNNKCIFRFIHTLQWLFILY